MHDRSSTADGVDDARLDMFDRKQRPYEAIPPTQAALLQHVKRAAYQAGCIWGQSLVCQPEIKYRRWTKKGDLWQILWTDLPPLQKVAKNWPSVVANMNVMEGANATALVLLAQHCLAADVKFKLRSIC